MRYGRIVLAALVATLIEAIYSWVTCGNLFKWVYELEPTMAWRTLESTTWAFWLEVNLGNLVFSAIFVFLYALLFSSIPGRYVLKGIMWGLFVWLLGTVPGMFATGMFMNISQKIVIYWTIIGLVKYLLIGTSTALVYGKKG